MQEKCAVKGCNRKIEVKKHGLCRTHYCRYRSKGEPGKAEIPQKKFIKPYQVCV